MFCFAPYTWISQMLDAWQSKVGVSSGQGKGTRASLRVTGQTCTFMGVSMQAPNASSKAEHMACLMTNPSKHDKKGHRAQRRYTKQNSITGVLSLICKLTHCSTCASHMYMISSFATAENPSRQQSPSMLLLQLHSDGSQVTIDLGQRGRPV